MPGTIVGSFEHKQEWEMRHVDADGNPGTMDARKNLSNYLRMYYHGAVDRLNLKLTLRDVDGTGGKALNPVAVGRWEVEHALALLLEDNPLHLAVLRLHLEYGFGWRRIARETGHGPTEAQAAFDAALDWLVACIYDWTEGGQRLAAASQAESERAAKERNRPKPV